MVRLMGRLPEVERSHGGQRGGVTGEGKFLTGEKHKRRRAGGGSSRSGPRASRASVLRHASTAARGTRTIGRGGGADHRHKGHRTIEMRQRRGFSHGIGRTPWRDQ